MQVEGILLGWLLKKRLLFFLILIILLCQVGGWVKNSRGCRGNWEGPRCFETTVCWRPKSSWGTGPAGPLQSLLLTSWEQQEETGEPSPHVLEGLVDWSGCFFFFVFFHTYIHTKWVSFLVNVPCLAIKTVCLDLWCWELNAHYWCKYCFCFPFRLEGTRPVTLEQMLIFCLRDWLHTPTRVSQPPYNSVPPWQQWVSEDIPRGKHMRSDPAPSPPSILLHLHRVYGVRDTQVSNLWVNLSPCEGKMLSCFLHHFSHNSEVCNYSMHFFFGWPGVIIPFKGTAGVMLGYNSCTHEEWKT